MANDARTEEEGFHGQNGFHSDHSAETRRLPSENIVQQAGHHL
jgi:hypothetical protein